MYQLQHYTMVGDHGRDGSLRYKVDVNEANYKEKTIASFQIDRSVIMLQRRLHNSVKLSCRNLFCNLIITETCRHRLSARPSYH